MKFRRVPALVLTAALLAGSTALTPIASLVEAQAVQPAGEKAIGLDAQTGVAITIYNQDLALVRDRRALELDAGANSLAFVDVSALMRPETALLRAKGVALTVLEQNFNFDLLTHDKLLEKSVGGAVRVVTVNPATGDETIEEAILLSIAGGLPVLRIGDRIETLSPGRIVFSEVPATLRARPTLVIESEATVAGPTEAELNYLTGGLSWAADYVAQLSPDEKTLDLNGWVTLTNMSGTSYNDAKLQLVAGDVHRVQDAMYKTMDTMMAEGAVLTPPAMAEEQLLDYHLYTLGRTTTIAENQTKQVALMSASAVPVEKEYRFANISNGYSYAMGETPRHNATVTIQFENKEADNLGLPLPLGTIRVYKNDSEGSAQFVGEDRIDHTPKNEEVRLTLGQAFDVTAKAKQTGFEQLSDRVYESAYEVEFKNAKDEPVIVTLVEDLPAEWKILEESHPHVKDNAFRASWQIEVPAGGSTVFSYAIRVTY